MTASTNGATGTAMDGLPALAAAGGDSVDATARGRRFRMRKFDETAVHDAVTEATGPLLARIAELEAQLTEMSAQLGEARNQVPDIASLSNADLAVLASDAAASILRVARTEADSSAAKSEKMLTDAQVEAARQVEQAEQEAAELLATAMERAQSALDEAEREVKAKQEAAEAAIVEAAEQANREAARLAAEAHEYCEQRTAEADDYAEEVRNEADTYAVQVRTEAQATSERALSEARANAEMLLADAKKRAEERVAEAMRQAEQVVKAATDRRDALFADLEVQRHLVQSTLEDAASIQAAFVEGYGRLRKTLDESVAHLIEPVQRARRQVANLDRELAQHEQAELPSGSGIP